MFLCFEVWELSETFPELEAGGVKASPGLAGPSLHCEEASAVRVCASWDEARPSQDLKVARLEGQTVVHVHFELHVVARSSF